MYNDCIVFCCSFSGFKTHETEEPGKSKGKRKSAASKGPTKVELKYKVRGHTSLVVTLISLCLSVCIDWEFNNSFKLNVQSIQLYNFYSSHAKTNRMQWKAQVLWYGSHFIVFTMTFSLLEFSNTWMKLIVCVSLFVLSSFVEEESWPPEEFWVGWLSGRGEEEKDVLVCCITYVLTIIEYNVTVVDNCVES